MLAFNFCCFSPINQIRLYFSHFTPAFRACPHLYLLAFTTAFCISPSHQLHTFLNLSRFFSPSYMPPNILTQFTPYNLSYKWMLVYSPQTNSATASCNFWYILFYIVKKIIFLDKVEFKMIQNHITHSLWNGLYFNGSFNKVLQNEFPAQRRKRKWKYYIFQFSTARTCVLFFSWLKIHQGFMQEHSFQKQHIAIHLLPSQ